MEDDLDDQKAKEKKKKKTNTVQEDWIAVECVVEK